MNPSSSSQSGMVNPFLRKTVASTPAPTTPVASSPFAHTTPNAPKAMGEQKPFSPFPGQPAPVSGVTPPPPMMGSVPPPPPTQPPPFMPRSATPFAPPPVSSMAPPPMNTAAPPTEMHDGMALQGTTRPKKGKTAAQLYALQSIGSEPAASSVSEQAKEPQKQEKPAAIRGPEKPHNSMDRLNLNLIPHPEEDDHLRHFSWKTDEDAILTLPPPNSQYIYTDSGNSNPRYMRPTIRIIPQTYYLLNKTKVPVSLLVNPFAEPGVGEESIPEVDGTRGIVRCHSCFAYMNPYFKFTNQGHSFICNICGEENQVPGWYYNTTDVDGKRFDRLEKPELSRGSYDIIAGKEFYDRPAQEPIFCFVIDITLKAQTLGVLAATISAIQACVESLRENERAKIGLCLVDTACYMLCMKNGRIREVIMSDGEDAYAVINSAHWLLSPSHDYDHIQLLLNHITTAYVHSALRPAAEHAMTISAVKTVAGALAYSGGHVIVIESTAPMIGTGRVSAAENVSFYGAHDESQLYLCSQDESFYTELGTACALSNVTVDMIIACKEHVHLAEQMILPYHTGGHVYVMNELPGEYQNSYLSELHAYIQNLVLKPHYWNVVMKMRVSGGIKVESYCGCLTLNEDDDPIVPLMDSDSTLEVCLELPKHISEPYVYAQMAILKFLHHTYTNEAGQRRIRIFNQQFQTTESYPRFFKGIDGTAIAMSLARTASIQSDTVALPEVRENLQDTVEEILTQYRSQCSANSSEGQLVLPENGKLLPLWMNGLLKSPALVLNEKNKRELMNVMPRGDIRAWALQFILHCSPSQFLDFVFPSLYKLDPTATSNAKSNNANNTASAAPPAPFMSQLPSSQTAEKKELAWGEEDEETGFLMKPMYLFLESASLDMSNIYLLSGWRGIVFIVGNQVPSPYLQSLFGVTSIPDSATAARLTLLPEGDEFCERVNALVNDFQTRYGYHLQPRVVVRGTTEASKIMEMMTEDAMRNLPSFSDFLMQIHSNIIASI